MAILEMIGFEDFPDGPAPIATLTLCAKGLMMVQGRAGNTIRSEVVNDRRRLFIDAYGDAPYAILSMYTTAADLKTKKHWGGFRYQAKTAITNNWPILRVRFWATPTTDVTPALIFDIGDNAAKGQLNEVYVEYCIDVPNLLVTAWIDGVKIREQAITQAVADSITDVHVWMGQYNDAVGQSYNDMYLVKDTSQEDGGSTPSRRLGPCKVRSLKPNSLVLGEGWTNPTGEDPLVNLQVKTLIPANVSKKTLVSSTLETKAVIGFEAPQNKYPIQAVSIRNWVFRDTGTSPNMVTQLKQGETLTAPVMSPVAPSAPRTGSSADKLGVYNRALDGSGWTPEKLDQLEIHINSKVGG